MDTNTPRCMWSGCAVIALAALAALAAPAVSAETRANDQEERPVVVAAAATSETGVPQAAPVERPYPAHERGVRQAAAESNAALRRYIWRTRMIYNFYFDNFARAE